MKYRMLCFPYFYKKKRVILSHPTYTQFLHLWLFTSYTDYFVKFYLVLIKRTAKTQRTPRNIYKDTENKQVLL
jgi:hypothetical protein